MHYRQPLLVWCGIMNNLTPAAYWFDHFWSVFEQVLDRVIASDNKSLISEIDMSSLCLSFTRVQVQPYLEIVTLVGLIHIVENYSFLAVVAVPPHVLGL